MWSVERQRRTDRKGEQVKNASKTTVVGAMLFFVGLWVLMAAGITAVWLTEEVRVFGLVVVPTVVVAGLLVAYFDWRARLRNRVRDNRREYPEAA